MLAAPSGTPRSVTAHVLTARGSCITVAEDPAIAVAVVADDDDAGHASGVTLPGADCTLLVMIPVHFREAVAAAEVDEDEDDDRADADAEDDEEEEDDEDDDDENDEAAAMEIVCVCTSPATATAVAAAAAVPAVAAPRARCAGYN